MKLYIINSTSIKQNIWYINQQINEEAFPNAESEVHKQWQNNKRPLTAHLSANATLMIKNYDLFSAKTFF